MLGVNLSGAEFGSKHRYGYDYIYPSESDIAFYASKGVELIRLPFKWERMQKEPGGELNPAELGRLKAFLAAAERQGVEVILDLHNYGRYGGKVLGTPELTNEMFADFWQKLVKEVGSSSAIYGYGLMNEPHKMGGENVWRDAAQAAVDAIREVDTENTIIVAGDGWSSARNWLVSNKNLLIDDPADKLLYEAHVYFDNDNSGVYDGSYEKEGAYPTMGADRIKNFVKWLEDNNVKGFIGEFAVPDNDPRWLAVLDNFLATLEELDMPATYWGAGPWFGNYNLGLRKKDGSERPQLDVLEKYLGEAESKTVKGTSGADTLAGDRGQDLMAGLGGDDVLMGSLAADTFDGGAGSDTASYAKGLSAIDIDLQRTVQRGSTAEGDRLIDVENVSGTRFDDLLRGDAGANRLFGAKGDDRLTGRGGADVLDGGEGNDTADYSASAGAVNINLSARVQRGGDAEGDNIISIENILGSAHNDLLSGDKAKNRIDGAGGDDYILASGRGDTIDGGSGTDTLDFAHADAGLELDLGTGANNRKMSVTNVENVIGTGEADEIVGSAGVNTLSGGAGSDRLDGGAGADRLFGGGGKDVLIGGGGGDMFCFEAADLKALDKILDFSRSEGDRIDLTAIDANGLLGGDQGFSFIGDRDFSGKAGELRSKATDKGYLITGDLNGDGVSDFSLLIQTDQPLTSQDFVL